MFIAVSTFTIANDMAPEVREAFINRPHFVDSAQGFVKLQVLIPQDNPDQIYLMTYWEDEDSYKTWYKNHMKESHAGIPKGLKLVPNSTKIRFFDLVSD
ncbi:antibiotic biosynthesis monooxygenase [Pontibacter korlensis]|uniref:Polysaccharide biosynthesis rotein n=1 Tax=Pontibacter korlensis TaxID=400092 RepID=A0A0E3ZHP3_9BACT|nr:antibiotic biosynthesis monooxygenase [Pontibacter korlensis]AKD04915.1 polysaccharide biosynthesis rotein [Pontibacter korlensis]